MSHEPPETGRGTGEKGCQNVAKAAETGRETGESVAAKWCNRSPNLQKRGAREAKVWPESAEK